MWKRSYLVSSHSIWCSFGNGIVSFLLLFLVKYFHLLFFRLSHQQVADHGQAGAGSLRAVQLGDRPRRPCRGHQQEAVARSHQRPGSAVLNHVGGFHPKNTVSIFIF